MFQSPDYPKSLSSGNTDTAVQCSTSFTRKDSTGNMLIYLINGNMGNFTFQNTREIDYIYNFDNDKYT